MSPSCQPDCIEPCSYLFRELQDLERAREVLGLLVDLPLDWDLLRRTRQCDALGLVSRDEEGSGLIALTFASVLIKC